MEEITKKESSTDTYKINKKLELKAVNEGEPTANVLVHGENNEVKFVPRSSFEKGGNQTIDTVLAAGNTAVDKMLTINSYSGQPTVSILHGGFLSIINNFSGDKASLQSNQLFISNKADTERTTVLADGIKFNNSLKTSTLMVNPNSQISSTGKVLLPITNDSSVKTLAAIDDFKTINGENIVGSGNIVIAAGGNATSGTFTPIMTNATNVEHMYIDEALWTKIGNVVTVKYPLQIKFIEPSKTSSVRISLPFSIASGSTNLGIGNLVSPFSVPLGGIVQRSTANEVLFITTSTTDPNYHVGTMMITYTTAS